MKTATHVFQVLNVGALLAGHRGRFNTVTFRKLDGTLRRINGKVMAVRNDYVVIREARTGLVKSFYTPRLYGLAMDKINIREAA